ncbi:MAG: S8 family serine peptidase [Deltaproteobacteria bacterium]|nr:S8 family serine peptidase [Deltaproteobacteria bacterium]
MRRMILTILIACVAVAGFVPAASADEAIQLKTRSFTPPASADVAADIAKLVGRHGVIQMNETPDAGKRAALAEKGVHLLKALPGRAYLAFIEEGARVEKSTAAAFRWAGELNRADKTHPLLAQGKFVIDPEDDAGRRVMDILMFPDVTEETGRRILENAGSEILGRIATVNGFTAALNPSAVPALAEEDAVLWIAETEPAYEPFLDVGKPAVGGDEANAAPYFTTGKDVGVLVLDGGTVFGHKDLEGRLTQIDVPIPDFSGHAHHVSCIVAGDGTMSGGQYTGMAPDASIVSASTTGLGIPPLYSNAGNMERVYENAIQNHNATVSNNSIGANLARLGASACVYEGDYSVTAQVVDTIVGEEYGRIHIVWSAGNERGYVTCGTAYNTSAPPATAKNSIGVGALNKEDLSMTSFSSWGPTDDGRIRPDVSAPGCDHDFNGIRSCWLADRYTDFCGTSQSGPIVAGSVALAQEYWRRTVREEDAWASTMKALVIHSAIDQGEPGPNYRDGFGALDVPSLLDHIDGAMILEEELDQGDAFTLDLYPFTNDVKVTLVWTDPAATALAATALINDLDLSVITGDGTELPWILNPSSPATPATKGENHRDPVEQVQFDSSGVDGPVSVVVEGANVPEGPQRFSLVITGLQEEAPDGGAEDDDADDDATDDDAGDDDDDDGGGCGC